MKFVPENFSTFKNIVCSRCTAVDGYCPTNCDLLMKAERIPFEKIQKSIIRNDEDYKKVFRYINNYYKKDK